MEKRPYEKPSITTERMEFGQQAIFCIKEKWRRRLPMPVVYKAVVRPPCPFEGGRPRPIRVPPLCWPPVCKWRLWS